MAYPANLLTAIENSYRQHFGFDPSRASVSFLGVESIEVLKFGSPAASTAPARAHYLSLGMSRYPMAGPAAAVIDEQTAPRAELLLQLREELDGIWRTLAVLAAAPAVEASVYAPGGRVHLPDPLAAGSRCMGAIISAGPLPAVAAEGIASVQILQLLPATATELAWARIHGSGALLQRWELAGTDLTDLWREPVELAER